MKFFSGLIVLTIGLMSCNKNNVKSEFDNMSITSLNEVNNINKIVELLKSDSRFTQVCLNYSILSQQMKINKTSSNYNNFINVLSNAKDLNELNSFFYKPENVNFK